LSPDSVQPNATGTQGFNEYAYVANNPTTFTDPTGHMAFSESAALSGAALGAMTGLYTGVGKCGSDTACIAGYVMAGAVVGGVTGGYTPAGLSAGMACLFGGTAGVLAGSTQPVGAQLSGLAHSYRLQDVASDFMIGCVLGVAGS